jgi:BMFP domain-containing protein YqiC
MEIDVGGLKFKGGKIFMVLTALSTAAGIVWGAALFWQDYMAMKEQIQQYVAPDLSDFDKRLEVIQQNSEKAVDYTRDIKNDLKADIRKLEDVVETVERSTKEAQRDMDKDLRELRKEVDMKIKKALDNPLAGMNASSN